MATKNLSRSVFECGRSEHFKYERRAANRCFRREAKAVMRDVTRGDAARIDALPVQDWVEIETGSRYSPAYRWLAKRGRGMNRAELAGLVHRSFDLRRFSHWATGRACLLFEIKRCLGEDFDRRNSRFFRFSCDGILLGTH